MLRASAFSTREWPLFIRAKGGPRARLAGVEVPLETGERLGESFGDALAWTRRKTRRRVAVESEGNEWSVD